MKVIRTSAVRELTGVMDPVFVVVFVTLVATEGPAFAVLMVVIPPAHSVINWPSTPCTETEVHSMT